MSYRIFSQRLNQELDNIGAPVRENERIEAFAKMFDVTRAKAKAYLEGSLMPEQSLLEAIAEELEVKTHYLMGKEDSLS